MQVIMYEYGMNKVQSAFNYGTISFEKNLIIASEAIRSFEGYSLPHKCIIVETDIIHDIIKCHSLDTTV